MPVTTNDNLEIYCLNVGQGDTTIVLTPEEKVIVIDAIKPFKTTAFLEDLGLIEGDPIQHIIVTHPHDDHYKAVEPIINLFNVKNLTLSSLRHYKEKRSGYLSLINRAFEKNITPSFLSGYRVLFPDSNPFENDRTMKLELLGPSNQFIEDLSLSGDLEINHYSILARLEYGFPKPFHMIISGDAQMENWAHFDREQLLNQSCTVLRSAHHGSANGTQYERIKRLSPRVVIVSSDPDGKNKLPDLIGSAVMLRYASTSNRPIVALTKNTGTIKIVVKPNGKQELFFYKDEPNDNVNLKDAKPLTADSNPTNWKLLLNKRISARN